MTCPVCQTMAMTQTVGSTTLLACFPFTDSEGREHLHDRNRVRTVYRCENEHQWVVTGKKPCWCGWPDEEPTIYIRP
jgi:hypothetical protein